MSRLMRVFPAVLMAGIALLLGARAAHPHAARQIPFEVSDIFFEFNSSAQDLGVQVTLDGEPWVRLEIFDPNGNKFVDVRGENTTTPNGTVKGLGLTELFYESDEPSFDSLTFDQILALYPEGTYRFIGVGENGDEMVGTAHLTHDIPNGPVILSPAPGGRVDRNNVVISWLPVRTPAGIQILRYEVTIEKAGRTFNVDVPPGTTSVTVSKEFLKPGMRYLFEVQAKEVSGNQTFTEGSFETK